ncbi:transcriptional activator NhaR [Marinomonas sp. THO17]|uniref:transcriptional activator NhaR n=1 Tax=Marinomonas sp. THO17 TaxID=3149048 RepID=UPI00336BD59B
MINFKHLHYFWVVAKQGSINKASKILHITPQTISGQIHLLEDQLGTTLFEKVGRRLQLTDMGRMALGYADDIFALGGELEQNMKGKEQDQTQFLQIGIADAVPKSIAYRLIKPALNLDYPVRIVCKEDSLPNLLSRLALHKLDLIIADGPIPENIGVRGFNHKLGKCGISFMASPSLMAQLVGEFPSCLTGAPMLIPSDASSLHNPLFQWLDKHQLQPKIAGEFDDSALMKAFGQAGVGVFGIPSAISQEVAKQFDVELVGVTNDIRQSFYAISTQRRLTNPAIVAINQAARDWLN